MNNQKIIKIKTVVEESVEDFDKEVNKLLAKGYQPLGSTVIRIFGDGTIPDYVLSMVKYQNSEIKLWEK